MPRKPFLPLSMSGSLFPLGDLSLPAGSFLDNVGIDRLAVDIDEVAGEVTLGFRLLFIDEVAISAPGMDDLAFVIAPNEGGAAFPLALTVGNRFAVAIQDLESLLRTPPTILARANNTGTETVPVWERVEDEPYEIELPAVSVELDSNGNVELESDLSLDIRPCFIGDTGCVFTATGVRLHLTSDGEPPAGRPNGWRGLLIEDARFYLPEDFALGDVMIRLTNAGVGNGGAFGTISASWTNTLREEEPHVEGPATGTLLGIHLALKEIALTFEQNVPVSSMIRGEMLIPFFDKAIGMKLSLAVDGDFMIELYAAAGSSDAAHLVCLDLEGLLRVTVKSAQFSRIDELAKFSLAGDITPLVGGFDWPTFEIEKLSVDENGNVDIQGGWIELPETFSLDFHAFKIDIDEIGLGSQEETGRDWFGFSGGIRLIEGVPLSASVDGLQVSWDPEEPPTASDPLRGVQVTLEGVAVHLEIPGTLILDGSVRYREIARPPETRGEDDDTTAAATGVFGHVFTGSISLDITALRTQVAGELLIGELTQYGYDEDSGALVIGETFPAFYIVLSAQFPAAIPLGATGAGLYGLAGLFGIHVAPNRQLVGEEPEPWYEWYKADRGESSAYSVTKVIKWGPRFDHYAFGAGLTIGTVYDDGFTINAGALVAILLPGPVVMIEGKANLLKQRGGNGQGADGALYMLIVVDGVEETLQVNVDINFTLEDVITVGGGMEAFFDFKDGSRWYIYIGRKDPETKRIRAEVISIITATAYFMIDPTAIVMGAAAGLDLQLEYGPLIIRLILRIAFEIAVFFNSPQLTGFVELYGEISILIFGFGIQLILQTLLEGSAPQPWWIHGLARVAVTLPFPLPSFDAQVEFTWGGSEQPARVPFLAGAAMIHPKELGRSWPLVTERDDAPLVPVDAIAVLSLGKPVSDVSTRRDAETGAVNWFDHETVEGWEFRYEIESVVLRDLTRGRVAGTGPIGPRAPWINALGRVLTDAAPSASPDAAPVVAPQLQLWGYSPLDALSPEAAAHYRDPCERGTQPSDRICVDWRDAPNRLQYGRMFQHESLAFSTTWARVEGATRADRLLSCGPMTIRFPEPVTRVTLRYSRADAVTATLRGLRVHAATGGTGDHELSVPGTIDALQLTLPRRGTTGPADTLGIAIIEICYTTQRAVDALVDPADYASTDRGGQIARPLLEPDTLYALEVTARRGERIVGDSDFTSVPETATYYFQTAEAPGLNLTSGQLDALSAGERAAATVVDFRDGPLNDLATYVETTTPAHGAVAAYGGYDVAVAFDAPYVAALYDPELQLAIRDHNGKLLVGDAAVWADGVRPLLTPGLLAFLRAPREGSCAGTSPPWTPHVPRRLVCSLPETLPKERLYRAEIVARGSVLYTFSFSLSRFRDFADHFASPPVHTGVAFATSITPDLARYDTLAAACATARERWAATITVGSHDSGVTLDEAIADKQAARAELDAFTARTFDTLDASVQPSFVALGLGHRPRPRRLELVRIEDSAGVVLLLDSPESVDRARFSIARPGFGNARVFWSADGTRAFVCDATPTGRFSPAPLTLELAWQRGGVNAPDLAPLYRSGTLDVAAETIRWTLALP
jgi:hypothetical protein